MFDAALERVEIQCQLIDVGSAAAQFRQHDPVRTARHHGRKIASVRPVSERIDADIDFLDRIAGDQASRGVMPRAANLLIRRNRIF